MRRAWLDLVLAMVLVLALGCEGNKQPPPTDLQVGSHRIQVQIPEGWEHVNYGDRHQLRQDMARVSIERIKWRGKNHAAAIANALVQLGEGEQRDVAASDTLTLGGRDALLVDTWDRVSHQWPKRFLFVWTGQDFVTAATLMGEIPAVEPVFDAFIASFAFADSVKVAE